MEGDEDSKILRETMKRNILIYIIMRVLISIPAIFKKTLRVSLPNVFEIAICLFVYAAVVMFSICGYLYVYRQNTYQFAGNFIINEESHMKKSK